MSFSAFCDSDVELVLQSDWTVENPCYSLHYSADSIMTSIMTTIIEQGRKLKLVVTNALLQCQLQRDD